MTAPLLDLHELMMRPGDGFAAPIRITECERAAIVAALRGIWFYSGTHAMYRSDIAMVFRRSGIVDTEAEHGT